MSGDVFTRKDYLASNGSKEEQFVAHRRFYAQLVDEHTIRQVVAYIGADRILRSTDPYFNDIPLGQWDSMATTLHLACRFADLDDYATLSGLVCVAKEAARQYVESQQFHRTRAVPTGPSNGYGCSGKHLAQYWDRDMRVWFDIGDPHDTEADARAAADAYRERKRSHEGEGSGIWQCYACLGRVEALTEGADTKCPFCGFYELHLAEGSVTP